jgi:hypothetical protein
VKASQFDAKPDEVDHWTPYSHWCAGCWHWVVDCEHLLDPLPLEYHKVDDSWIQSLAYDRKTQCLEVRFKWKEGSASIPSGITSDGSGNPESAADEYRASRVGDEGPRHKV